MRSRKCAINSLRIKKSGGLLSGSEKGVFWKRGLFRKVHFLEILENLEILEILEKSQTVENKGESDFCSEKTPFVMTPFFGPDVRVRV